MEKWKELYCAMLEAQQQLERIKDYESKSWIKRLFCKRPVEPAKTPRQLAQEYTTAFNEQYNCYDICDQGDYVIIRMKFNDSTLLPILFLRTYSNGCYGIERLAYNENGKFENCGCPYPYSECGISKRMELEYMPDGADKVYDKFDEIVNSIQSFINNKN